MRFATVISAAVLASALATPSLAASCNPPSGFNAFLADMAKDAKSQGIGARGISALNGLTVDDSVLAAPDDAVSTMAGVSTVYVIEDGSTREGDPADFVVAGQDLC